MHVLFLEFVEHLLAFSVVHFIHEIFVNMAKTKHDPCHGDSWAMTWIMDVDLRGCNLRLKVSRYSKKNTIYVTTSSQRILSNNKNQTFFFTE